jgi:hypothetical protein
MWRNRQSFTRSPHPVLHGRDHPPTDSPIVPLNHPNQAGRGAPTAPLDGGLGTPLIRERAARPASRFMERGTGLIHRDGRDSGVSAH